MREDEDWGRFLDDGVSNEGLACIYRKRIILTNNRDQREFEQGMALVKKAPEEGMRSRSLKVESRST